MIGVQHEIGRPLTAGAMNSERPKAMRFSGGQQGSLESTGVL